MEWKRLSREARRVAHMANSPRKIAAAKKVEEKRGLLVVRIKQSGAHT